MGSNANIPVEKKAGNDHCNYILIFYATKYNSRIADAVDYFFKEILKEEDHLTIVTPIKPYDFPHTTRQKVPEEKLVEVTKKVLKRDITVGTSDYHNTLNSMIQIVRAFSPGGSGGAASSASAATVSRASTSTMKSNIVQYRQYLENLVKIRKINENLFVKFADFFKEKKGKNYIFIFYQKELRPIPNRQAMEILLANMELKFEATHLFRGEIHEEFMDVEKVTQALKDASITVCFNYLNIEGRSMSGVRMIEFSNDIYNSVSRLARETGGIIVSTSNPEAAIKKFAKAISK